MEKNILNEINRNREIMGLGQILREAASADPDKVKIWMNSDGKDSSSSIQSLVARFVEHGYLETTINGMNIWAALNQAFYNMTGIDIVDENGQGTTAAFGKGQFANFELNVTKSSERPARPLIMIEGKKLRVNSTELGLSGDNEIGITELIDKINTFNIENAGGEQIVYAEEASKYKTNGNTNSLISNKKDDMIFLWSIKKSESVRNVTGDVTIPGDVIAGDVLQADLGDSFENLQIEMSDKSKVTDIKSKMKAIVNNGGTIDSVTITSTASNTGLKDGGKTNFATMMKKAGFESYANVSNVKGDEGDFTIDEVNTTDRALAVARGKLLAKFLGVGDKATFKFSITNGPKTVNLTVKGSSPETKEDDITTSGSIDDRIKTSYRGKSEEVYPYITYIKIKGRGFFDKIGDGLGITKAKILQNKV
jgi:hypothetical protein